MGKKLGLVDLMESLGNEKFLARIKKLVREKDENKPSLKPEDFSIREIWEVCQIAEAIDPSMFPKITGELISKKVMDAYDLAVVVADELVTNVPSSKEVEKVTGFTEVGSIEKVPAGMPYPEHGMGEKYVEITNAKYGDMINITEEAIMFDQTGQILVRAGRLGKAAAQYKEEIVLNTIQDITGYLAYYPSGTNHQLYTTAADTVILYLNEIASNGLVDETDITADLVKFALMLDDSPKKKPVVVKPTHILTPVALEGVALKLWSSTVTLAATSTAGVPNIYRGRYKVISSPYLDAQAAGTWYLGDFKQQFMWQEVIPVQVLRAKAGNEEDFMRDIKARFKVRFFGGAGAVDFRFAIKNTA